MNYQALLFDARAGHHKCGDGATPPRAVLSAFRKIAEMQMLASGETSASAAEKVGNLQTDAVLKLFLMVAVDDEYYENPKTLKEDVHEVQVLVRVDRSSDVMHVPCGIIRPKI